MKTTAFTSLAAFLLAGTAWAQDATPPAEDAAGSEVGQLYARESHGAFEVRCLRAPEGQADPCRLYQRLNDADGSPTAEVNFFVAPADSGAAGGATVVTPLRTLLTEQLTVSVDGGPVQRYPFTFCDAQGCIAQLGFTEDDMAAFRRGAAATVTVVPVVAPDRPAVLEMSLAGFTAGMAALEPDGSTSGN